MNLSFLGVSSLNMKCFIKVILLIKYFFVLKNIYGNTPEIQYLKVINGIKSGYRLKVK